MSEGYICPTCGKAFTKMCSLRRHISNYVCSCKIEITEDEQPLFDVEKYINMMPNNHIVVKVMGSLCSLKNTKNK